MTTETPSASDLRNLALRLRSDVGRRINEAQGGVPTFFDGYLVHLIDHLVATEKIHGWNYQPKPMPGTELGNLGVGLHWLTEFLAKHDHDRFVTYQSRRAVDPRRVCEIGPFELLMSQGIVRCLEWKGRPLFKTVFDFALVPMLIHDIKPATIFEIGSGNGASALWMADICAMEELPVQIYSVDIRPVAEEGNRVVAFYAGDANEPTSLFPADLLRTAPHPWLVIEDAHVNVLAVLRHFERFLTRGDYLVVEDSRDKHHDLASFVTDRYRVDSRFTDFFGRNSTSAEDSIFALIEA